MKEEVQNQKNQNRITREDRRNRRIYISDLITCFTRIRSESRYLITLSYDVGRCASKPNKKLNLKAIYMMNRSMKYICKKSFFFYDIECHYNNYKKYINGESCELLHVHYVGTITELAAQEDRGDHVGHIINMKDYEEKILSSWQKINDKIFGIGKQNCTCKIVPTTKEYALLYLTSEKKLVDTIRLRKALPLARLYGIIGKKNCVISQDIRFEFFDYRTAQYVICALLKLRFPNKEKTVRKHLLMALVVSDKGINGIHLDVAEFILDYLSKDKIDSTESANNFFKHLKEVHEEAMREEELKEFPRMRRDYGCTKTYYGSKVMPNRESDEDVKQSKQDAYDTLRRKKNMTEELARRIFSAPDPAY